MTTRTHRLALVAAVAVLLTACSTASEPATQTEVVTDDSQSEDAGSQDTSAPTDTTAPTDTNAPETTVSSSPTGPVDASHLTQTEYLMVGTWELISISEPDKTWFGTEIGDTCTFAADLSLECTISGEKNVGEWIASDSVEIGELSIASSFAWLFRTASSSSGGSSGITVDETEMAIGFGDDTWALVERPQLQPPLGEWTDAATQELMGSWTLISTEKEYAIESYAVTGDTCTFNPDHTLVCDGEDARPAIWQTTRSILGGTMLRLEGGAGLSGDFGIDGDVLTWGIVDSVWHRTE